MRLLCYLVFRRWFFYFLMGCWVKRAEVKLLSTAEQGIGKEDELGETQPAFTCSKLTIETLEQGVKYVQS